MGNWMIAGIVLILVGAACFYIRKEKKKGTNCIGCPSAGCCQKKCDRKKASCKCHTDIH